MTSRGQVTIPEATPPKAPQMLLTVGSGSFVQYMARLGTCFVGIGMNGLGVEFGLGGIEDGVAGVFALKFSPSLDMIGPPSSAQVDSSIQYRARSLVEERPSSPRWTPQSLVSWNFNG
jgi:hypothetical protein